MGDWINNFTPYKMLKTNIPTPGIIKYFMRKVSDSLGLKSAKLPKNAKNAFEYSFKVPWKGGFSGDL